MTTAQQIDNLLAFEFPEPPSPWRRSQRGNHFRRLLDGRVATVFRRASGFWYWCVGDGRGCVRFSGCGFGTVADAAAAVNAELEATV